MAVTVGALAEAQTPYRLNRRNATRRNSQELGESVIKTSLPNQL